MNLEEMTIEELEALRNDLQAEMEKLRARFVEAGKVLDIKRQLESISAGELESQIAEAEAQTIRLKELKAKAASLGLGG